MPIRQFSFQTCVLKILIDKGSWKESYLKASREKELVFSLAQKCQLLTDLAKKREYLWKIWVKSRSSCWKLLRLTQSIDDEPWGNVIPKKIDEERRYSVTKERFTAPFESSW